MKTAFALILMLSATIAQTKEIPDGFNGYLWGTNRKDVDSLTLGAPADSSEKDKRSTYKSYIKTFGDCVMSSCIILFIDDELVGVNINGKGEHLYDCLNALFVELYGQGTKLNDKKKFVTFNTQLTTAYLACTEEWDPDTNHFVCKVVASVEESITARMDSTARKVTLKTDVHLAHARAAAQEYLGIEGALTFVKMGAQRLNGLITITYMSNLWQELNSIELKASIGDTVDRILLRVKNERLEIVLHNGSRKIASGLYDPTTEETIYKFF